MERTGTVQGASTDGVCICRYLGAAMRGGGIQADPWAVGLSNWRNDTSPHSLQEKHVSVGRRAEGLETKQREAGA